MSKRNRGFVKPIRQEESSPMIEENTQTPEEPIENVEAAEPTGPTLSNEDVVLARTTSASVEEPASSPGRVQVTGSRIKRSSTSKTNPAETELFYEAARNFNQGFSGPRPQENTIAALQVGLYGLFCDVLNSPVESAKERLESLLGYIHARRDKAFTDVNLFLSPNAWTAGVEAYNRYRVLATLFLKTCNEKTRQKDLLEISLEKILKSKHFTKKECETLINFYM
jgi:hypothetical protein